MKAIKTGIEIAAIAWIVNTAFLIFFWLVLFGSGRPNPHLFGASVWEALFAFDAWLALLGLVTSVLTFMLWEP